MENERNQNRRLEKDLTRALDNYNSQKILSQRQRMVATQLIKEKRRLQKELSMKCEQIEQLESKLGLKSTFPGDSPVSTNALVSIKVVPCWILIFFCFKRQHPV